MPSGVATVVSTSGSQEVRDYASANQVAPVVSDATFEQIKLLIVLAVKQPPYVIEFKILPHL